MIHSLRTCPVVLTLYMIGGGAAIAQVFVDTSANFTYDAFVDTALTPKPYTVPLESALTDVPNIPFELFHASPYELPAPNVLTITPTRGITPAKISIDLNPNVVPYLKPGEYVTLLSFRSTDPAHPGGTGFFVSLSLHGQGPPTISGVVNSASQQTGFAPGTIITIYGTYLGTQPVSATSTYSVGFDNKTVYPTALGNSTVSIGGSAAPLLYVSPNQINAIIPYEQTGTPGTLGANADVIVTHNGGASPPFRIPMTPISPGIFTAAASGQGQGAIGNVDAQTGAVSVNSASNPAPKGSAIVLYATGGGELTQSTGNGVIVTNVLDPPYYAPDATVSLTIGGQPAKILYAGAAPGQVSGLLQVNAVLPTGIASGAQPVVLTIGGVPSQTGVTVAVQ